MEVEKRVQELVDEFMNLIPENEQSSYSKRIALFFSHYRLTQEIQDEFLKKILTLVDDNEHDDIYQWDILRKGKEKYQIFKIKGQHGLYAVIENRIGKKPKFRYCGSLSQCEAAKSIYDKPNTK